ncbi:YwqG family protein [Paenibacillus sp. LHD-117]|uniref:YwqG family protein n=1 Tax=Paenibacillus sp. LHD-117 TaxID=3071412 RepID=UPI0027DEFF5E|nr:YwqG family protein [Paenibacillus sp. LHD-117]MDQ6423651.1 YwqG family protein [Paenibacillus sp. LHD-117]
MQKDKKVIEIIESSGLTRINKDLMNNLSYSNRMTAIITEEENIPLGSSKIGGKPDLPSYIHWPNENGKILSFIAQVNLEEVELRLYELPSAGLLSFFYDSLEQPWGFDPNDRGRWKVIYNENLDRLERKELPEELIQEGGFGTCKVDFSLQTTLPSWESISIDQLNLVEHESDLYFELSEKVFEHNDSNGTIHRFLGHPDQIQGEMQLECQLASNGLYCGDSTCYEDPKRKLLESGAESWKLLLQIDSEEDIGMMWGDVGRIFFWIHEDDLREKNFNNVWLVLQCS